MATTFQKRKLAELATFKTGKLDSNAAIPDGNYPFFTCSQETLRTNTFSFDDECVLLAGNNANGIFPLKYFKGKFDAYQRTYVVRPIDVNLVTTRYLYYALRLKLDELRSFSTGAATKFLTLKILNGTEIPAPPVSIQKRIMGILAAYDELIEISERRVRILESMARALYRETLRAGFPTSKPLPIADSPYWRFVSENVSPYSGRKRYYATADIDGLTVNGTGIEYTFAEKPSRAQKQPIAKSVWFARMKDTYKIAWYGPVSCERVSGTVLSSGFAGFEAADAELWPLLFLTVSSKEFHVQKDLYCTGATQMSLTNEGLARIVMPLPDMLTARRLGRTTGPILSAMTALQQRNDNLRRTRDFLLPQLVSGQVDVESISS